MFKPEQLLEKIIKNAIPGQGGGKKGKKGKKGKSRGLLGSVTSGAALMTALGLGVGAYEILKSQKKNKNTQAIPPPVGGQTSSFPSPPPPPPPAASSKTEDQPVSVRSGAVVPAPSLSSGVTGGEVTESSSGSPSEEISLRMIQVMVAAAHADGVLDETEERNILERMGSADLTGEEKMFLLGELHNPKTVAELCAGITDISLAKGMYMMAVAAIEIDTEAERNWLDELGKVLGLSGEVRRFIEEHG